MTVSVAKLPRLSAGSFARACVCPGRRSIVFPVSTDVRCRCKRVFPVAGSLCAETPDLRARAQGGGLYRARAHVGDEGVAGMYEAQSSCKAATKGEFRQYQKRCFAQRRSCQHSDPRAHGTPVSTYLAKIVTKTSAYLSTKSTLKKQQKPDQVLTRALKPRNTPVPRPTGVQKQKNKTAEEGNGPVRARVADLEKRPGHAMPSHLWPCARLKISPTDRRRCQKPTQRLGSSRPLHVDERAADGLV